MNRVQSLAPALLVTVALAATPAMAQSPHSRDPHGARDAGQPSQADRGARPGAGVGRAEPVPAAQRPAPQAPPPAATRQDRGGAAQPRQDRGSAAQPRQDPPRVEDRRGAAVPRVTPPRLESPRSYDYDRRRAYERPYYRPYYAFRPRWSLGFGLWVGYPVAYPYYYPYPVPYPDPNYPSNQYPYGSVNVTPTNVGGLSFDITPSYADVYVDGQYMGTAADFGPTMPPLSLAPGRHYVDIRAADFAPMVFDADVLAGQVLPYRGSMRPE